MFLAQAWASITGWAAAATGSCRCERIKARPSFYPQEERMNPHTFRLKPGQDLFQSIQEFTEKQAIQAGCVLCGVGSLTRVVLRLANQEHFTTYTGHFEIVAITGTVSTHGSHLHIAVSDEAGKTTGGHLVPGCTIYTTAEIVIAVFPGIVYTREPCAESGYGELVVKRE
jgi:uncharacterized protein